MSEPRPEEENQTIRVPNNTMESSSVTRDFNIDLEIESSWSWQFDHHGFFHPLSPPLIASICTSPPPSENHSLLTTTSPESERCLSPLWNFSDGDHDDDDKFGGNNITSSIIGNFPLSPNKKKRKVTFLRSNSPKLIFCNEFVMGNNVKNGNKRTCLPPTIGPLPLKCPDLSYMIKERIGQGLRYFKESTEQKLLAQFWAPIKNGERYVLTTSGQAFVVDPNTNGLLQYKGVSLMYMYSADGETDGLPSRVFQRKLMEWTPNVQYNAPKEYPQLNHALNYNVKGTLALPVFEHSSHTCVGVLEIIMTSQKVNYSSMIDQVCRSLEAVNLKSAQVLDSPKLQICDERRHHALSEISEILNVVCEIYKLPMAQTWVPCRDGSVLTSGGRVKRSCSSFDGGCMGTICLSTSDAAFYVRDAHMWGFRDACSEHHLQKGQGVAGKAFSCRGSCFSRNITGLCKTEYPLVHYALMFGLVSCFAICLHSTHTGSDDYVIELFLPNHCIISYDEEQALLVSLMATMKQHFQTVRFASEQNLVGENPTKKQDPCSFKVGDVFESAKKCRSAIVHASVLAKKDAIFVKSEKVRITAECATNGCDWRLYASTSVQDNGCEQVVVKTFSPNHTCNVETDKLATASWVSDCILNMIRESPESEAKDIQTFIKSQYDIDITYMTAWRARKKAFAENKWFTN